MFPRRKVVIFVDGCFWHGCEEHGTWPRHNAEWWRDKINANRSRDRVVDRHLQEEGWTVVRIWEHEPVGEAVDKVVAAVDAGKA